MSGSLAISPFFDVLLRVWIAYDVLSTGSHRLQPLMTSAGCSPSYNS